jgi:hypothetical protein
VTELSISMVGASPILFAKILNHTYDVDPEFIAMMTGRTREPKSEPAPVPASVAAVTEEPKPISDPEAAPIPVASELADPEDEWKAAWKEFDHSLNGSITAAQLRQVVANLGETISDVEVDGIMKSVDAEDKITCRCFSLLDVSPVFLVLTCV